MKMHFKLTIVSLIALCAYNSHAQTQNAADFPGLVTDLSRINNGGSARVLGLGSTQTALGGDISSVSSNPAGLGFFNGSEFSFSLQFNGLNSTSSYLDTSTDDSKLNLNVPNLGAVINTAKSKGKWKSQSFGVSLNRMADFQNNISYQGFNDNYDFISSAIDQENFVELTEATRIASRLGLTRDIDYVYQGEETIIIDGFEFDIEDFFGRVPNIGEEFILTDRNIFDIENGDLGVPTPEFPVFTQEEIVSRGAFYQFSLAYGANYDDRVYLGGGLGIVSFAKDVERTLTEEPSNTTLQTFEYIDNYEQDGLGINATLGVIARPIDFVLIGLSYTSPTYFAVNQFQEIQLSALYANGDFDSESFLFDESDYNISTPARLKGGATFFLGKSGFLTGEIERVQYSGGSVSNISDPNIEEADINSEIDRFNSSTNFRIGGEYRHDILRIRGGFAYLADPADDNLDQEERQFSFGLGIRKQKYYGDVAIVRSDGFSSQVSPYPFAPLATVEQNATRVTFTVGVRF
ncbi:MAG: hypothetical protein AAF693_04335 [Bacteroidota bacterium]